MQSSLKGTTWESTRTPTPTITTTLVILLHLICSSEVRYHRMGPKAQSPCPRTTRHIPPRSMTAQVSSRILLLQCTSCRMHTAGRRSQPQAAPFFCLMIRGRRRGHNEPRRTCRVDTGTVSWLRRQEAGKVRIRASFHSSRFDFLMLLVNC